MTRVDERAYERLKWTVLDEAPHHHTSSIAYYWAQRAFPDVDVLEPIVHRVLLELLDEGLIYFFWGGWDSGGDPHAAERPTRAEVEADLALDAAPPRKRTVWFTSTPAGEAKLATVESETLLGFEQQQRKEQFNARHPEYAEKFEEWLEATGRWVREGGRRPKPPWHDYDDYPEDVRPWRWFDFLPGSRLGKLLGRIFLSWARVRGREVEL